MTRNRTKGAAHWCYAFKNNLGISIPIKKLQSTQMQWPIGNGVCYVWYPRAVVLDASECGLDFDEKISPQIQELPELPWANL